MPLPSDHLILTVHFIINDKENDNKKGSFSLLGKKKRAKERRVKEVAVLSTVAVHPEQRIGAVCSAAVAVVDWLR